MATFVNNLRLKEITTGDESGTWGDSTNTNLELITDAFGTGTLQLAADANETFTIADGTADEARAMVLDITSAGSLTATRTVTLAPNTVNKVWVIKNSTTGGQAIEISQGSGANVTIANGETKAVYGDGAGSGAAVTDYLAGLVIGGAFGVEGAVTLESSLGVTGTATLANLTATGTIDFSGATVSDGGTVTTVDIDGGTVDGVVIGGSSAAAGTFTDLSASGTISLGTLADQTTINNDDWSGTDLALTNGGTGSSTASGARANLGLGSLATADTINNDDWSGTDLAVSNGGTGSSTTSGARSNLGLGSLATQSTINDGDWSGTDLAVSNGGTGSSTASGARSNLGAASTSTTITAGTALSGGGSLASNRTINWTGTSTDGVGQTIFGPPLNSNTYKKGDTLSGTAIGYANAAGATYQNPPSTLIVPGTGTWRCTGYAEGQGLVSTDIPDACTTWIRIS